MRRKKDKTRRGEHHATPPPVVTAETVREQRAAGLLSRITTLPLRPAEAIVAFAPPQARASSGFVLQAPPRGPSAATAVRSVVTTPPASSTRRTVAAGASTPPVADHEATTLRPRHYGLRLPDGSVQPVTQRAVVVGRRTDSPPTPPAETDVVSVDDPGRSLSRHHVSIALGEDGAVWVTDLDSGNGTTLVSTTGEITELVARAPTRVRVGSLLSIGDHTVTIVRRPTEA